MNKLEVDEAFHRIISNYAPGPNVSSDEARRQSIEFRESYPDAHRKLFAMKLTQWARYIGWKRAGK